MLGGRRMIHLGDFDDVVVVWKGLGRSMREGVYL